MNTFMTEADREVLAEMDRLAWERFAAHVKSQLEFVSTVSRDYNRPLGSTARIEIRLPQRFRNA